MQQPGKVLIGLIFLLLVAIPAVWSDSAETTNHAAIVVDYGNGSYDTACIAFQESTISGYELLSRSGLSLLIDVDGGMGAAICSINNVGCPASNCFCDAPNFWQYAYLNNNQWQSYQVGASSSVIEDGDVDSWTWGNNTQPPVVSFDEICSAEIDTPTPSPTSTNTPTPTPSLTPTPSITPTTAILPTKIVQTATPTPRPTATPRPTQTATATPVPTEAATQTPTETTTATSTPEVAENTPTPQATNTPPATPTDGPDSAEKTPDPTATPPPTATPIFVPTSTPDPATTDSPAPTATASPTPLPQNDTTVPTATVQPTDEARVPLGDPPVLTDPADPAAPTKEPSPPPTPVAIAERQLPTAEPIIFDPPGAGNGAAEPRLIGADVQLASAPLPGAIQPAPANQSQLSAMLPYLIFVVIVATLTSLILLAGRNKPPYRNR